MSKVANDIDVTFSNLNAEPSKLMDDYDINKGYAGRHIEAMMSRYHHKIEKWRGFDIIDDILDNVECRELIKAIDSAEDLEAFSEDDRFEIIKHVFACDPLTAKIYSYFQSHWIPLWMRLYKNEPDKRPEEDYSFYWHCDGGPSKHLKLLLYLNDSKESGATTMVLERDESDALLRIGYTFCPIGFRLEDLTELAQDKGISYNPIIPEIKAGNGLLFEPARISHRGIWPTDAPRYLVQIAIIPHIEPWYEACSTYEYPRRDNGWPDFAQQ